MLYKENKAFSEIDVKVWMKLSDSCKQKKEESAIFGKTKILKGTVEAVRLSNYQYLLQIHCGIYLKIIIIMNQYRVYLHSLIDVMIIVFIMIIITIGSLNSIH